MLIYRNTEKFYKKYGAYKLKDFIYPKVLKSNDIVFPINSIFHYFTNNTDSYPNRKIDLFLNVSKGMVTNIVKFIDPKYELRSGNINQLSLNNKYKKLSSDFITVDNNKLNYFIRNKKRFLSKVYPIYNYNKIEDKYILPKVQGVEYRAFINTFITIFKTIEDNHIHGMAGGNKPYQYLIVDMPNIFIENKVLKKFIKKDVNNDYYKIFYNQKRMFVIELFKSLFKENSENSILNIIKNKDIYKNVNLVLQVDDKSVIVNIYKLLSLVKDFDLVGDNKYNSMQVLNLFNFFIKILYVAPGFTMSEIENNINKDYVDKVIFNSDADKLNVMDNNVHLEKIIDIDENDIDLNQNDNPEKDIFDKIQNTTDEEDETEVAIKTIPAYKSIDEIMDNKVSIDNEALRHIENSFKNGDISKKQYTTAIENLKKSINNESPYGDGKSIKDMLTFTDKDLVLDKSLKQIPDSVTVFDKSTLSDTITAMDKKYIKDVYKKDIVSTIYAFEKDGLLVDNYEIEHTDDVLGKYEDHKVTFKPIDGRPNTIKFRLPVVNSNGTIKISSNSYRLRKQRIDVPIKKISNKRVALTSAYGKIFIDKAPYKNMDRGFSIKKELYKLNDKNKVNNIVLGTHVISDVIFPIEYSEFMRYIKSIKIQGSVLNFDYKNRSSILNKEDNLKNIEKDKMILLGSNKNSYILIDKDSILHKYEKGKYTKLTSLYEYVGLDTSSLADEFALIKIYKSYIPIVYLLMYYLTLDEILKMLNVKYTKIPGNKRIKDDTAIIFKTSTDTLIIHTDDPKNKMILNGLNYYKDVAKKTSYDVFNNKNSMLGFFKDINLKLVVITELNTLINLFVDPVTGNVLKGMNEPITFIGLVLRSAELLIDDNFKHPYSSKGYSIKGYEKIPQMLYKELIKSIKQKKSESVFGNSKMVLNPYSVWSVINEDSSSVLVDDINPIAYLKQAEDTTSGGFNGRSKESMSRATRELHRDDVGVISESSKDSGDVGITAYLSANPLLKNVRGIRSDTDNLDPSNIFSTSAMLAPFIDYDDPKRAMFANAQNSHVVAIKNATMYPVRTGYEPVLPYRLDSKFVGYVKEKCTVEKVYKNKVVVKYKDKKETFTFKDWTSKEESHSSWNHTMVSILKDGDKLEAGDIVYYDSTFFGPDLFSKNRIVYKPACVMYTALEEINETDEDSCVISKKMAENTVISTTKIESNILDKKDNIENLVKIGEKINSGDALYTLSSGMLESDGFDEEALDLLQGFIKNTPKSSTDGKIIKMILFYNCEKDDLSDSLKEIAVNSEKYLIDEDTGKKYTGKVNSGYSINGVPLETDKVELKIYIESESGMSTGDKAIFANQLKCTVGDIMEDTTTEAGDEVDAIFSARALSARVVLSPYLSGTTATLYYKLSENMAKIYFGED